MTAARKFQHPFVRGLLERTESELLGMAAAKKRPMDEMRRASGDGVQICKSLRELDKRGQPLR